MGKCKVLVEKDWNDVTRIEERDHFERIHRIMLRKTVVTAIVVMLSVPYLFEDHSFWRGALVILASIIALIYSELLEER